MVQTRFLILTNTLPEPQQRLKSFPLVATTQLTDNYVHETAWNYHYFYDLVSINEASHFFIGERSSAQIFFTYVRRSQHARTQATIYLNRDLQLFLSCPFRVSLWPGWDPRCCG